MDEIDVDVAKEEEDDIITCPVCGEEVETGTENCPLCGAPVGALENSNVSGTSIDNSAAIDAMLESAAMLVEESASLGVGPLDDDEEEDDGDESEEAFDEEEYDEEPEEDEEEEAAPMAPANATAMPAELTDEQVNKIKAGGMISISGGAEPNERQAAPAPKPKKAPKKKEASEPKLYNVDEKGNKLPDQDDSEIEAPQATPSQKKDSAKKSKKTGASPVLVVLTALVALMFGCAAGFFVKTLYFPEFPVPECQEFAERAILSVDSVAEGTDELYIAEAYVKDTDDMMQCVFRALVDKGHGNAENNWYRVKVYKDAPDTVRIYFEIDMEQYESLSSSSDQEQQIQASMLMNNQNELERCISEIESGSGGWKAANALLLNNTLHPFEAEGAEESAEE